MFDEMVFNDTKYSVDMGRQRITGMYEEDLGLVAVAGRGADDEKGTGMVRRMLLSF